MPLLRVGQKVVVSKEARSMIYPHVQRHFEKANYQGVIAAVDLEDTRMFYSVLEEGGDKAVAWFAEAEVTAASETGRDETVLVTKPANFQVVHSGASVYFGCLDIINVAGVSGFITPDEADQLSDMLHAAAAEARGTEGAV